MEEHRAYRGLIIKDFKLFLNSLRADLDMIMIEYKYGPYYN
jgi:hypothetical protein